jgi:hypothetical protein
MVARTSAVASRPGLQAYEDAMRASPAEVVSRLRDIIGVRVVAFIGNVKSTRPVAEWATGHRSPGELDLDRLRLAFHLAGLLREQFSPDTVQAWFKGMNPALGDVSPARVLRDADPAEVGPELLAAAKSFAYIG